MLSGRRRGSLKTQPADGRDVEIGRLTAKVGDLTMANELLATKIAHLEAGRPLAHGLLAAGRVGLTFHVGNHM
jgi:hypothetical protein